MTRYRSRLAWSLCLVGAVCSLAACDDGGMCTLEARPAGNFNVGLWTADGVLPNDLRIVLWSEYLWGENGHEASLTLEGIIQEPARRHEIGCRGMDPDAGVGEVERVDCRWGGGPVGTFQASAAGYQGIFLILFSRECDDCCYRWSQAGTSVELQPL